MKDPFYAGLIFTLEQFIYEADQTAESVDVKLTDSQIQSVLIKAKKLCQAGTPKLTAQNEKEHILQDLMMIIYHAPDVLMEQAETGEERPLEISDWLIAIDATLVSLKTRKSGTAGGRDYLNFLKGFIPGARGE